MGIELIDFRLAFCRLEGGVSFTSLSFSFFFFWFILKEISRCLFKICFWLCSVQPFYLVVTSRGSSLVAVLGLLILISLLAEYSLSSCGLWALGLWLSNWDMQLSCPAACGIFRTRHQTHILCFLRAGFLSTGLSRKSPLSLLEHEVLFFCFIYDESDFSFNSLTLPSGISHLL